MAALLIALGATVALAAPPARLECVAGAGPIRAALETRDGRHLVARDGALQVGDRVLTVCDGLPGAYPTALAESAADGAVYVGFRREGVWRWDAAGFTAVPDLPEAVRAGGVRALAVDGRELWVASGTAGLWHAAPGEPFAAVAHKVLGHQGVFALRAVSAGTEGKGGKGGKGGEAGGVEAAVGPYGAYRVRVRGAGVAVERLAGGFVGCFDPAGRPAVYCAPAAGAAPRTFAGPPTAHFTAVASAGGLLYAGSFDQGLFASADGVVFRRVEGVPPFVNALAAVGDALLIGTARGLYALDAGQAAARTVPGITAHVNALAVGPSGEVAVGTAQGVYVLEGGAVRHLGEDDGLPGRQCWAVAFAPSAAGTALWVGTADGLARFDAGAHVELFSQASGHLPHDWVTAVLPEGEDVLVGTYDAGVVALRPDAAAPLGWRREMRLAEAWVNPMGLTRVGDDVLVSTLGAGGGPLTARGFRSVLPVALDDVTAVVRHAWPAGTAGGGPAQVWFATRGGLVHAPEGWYRARHDAEQAHDDSPCAGDDPGGRLAGGVRLERGR